MITLNMATNYLEWIKLAETLSLEGDEKKAFIKERQAEERADRLAERQAIREAEEKEREASRSAEEKRAIREAEEKERQAIREAEEKARQELNELKKLELQLQNSTKMKELEVRLAQENRTNETDGVFRGSDNGRFVKIPVFKPEIDNLDGYLGQSNLFLART